MRGSVRLGCSAILFSRFQLRETLPTQSGLRFVLTSVMRKYARMSPDAAVSTPVMGKRTADDRVLNLVPAQMPKASSARTITPDSSKAPATRKFTIPF